MADPNQGNLWKQDVTIKSFQGSPQRIHILTADCCKSVFTPIPTCCDIFGKPLNPYLCTKESHPEHIEGLPLHILGTHVHYALQSKAGTHSGCCHSMLTCACLCNDPFLAQPLRQQGLSNCIVDLVSSCVIQILPLQIDKGALSITFVMLRKALGEVERGFPSHIVLQYALELLLQD